MTTAPGEITEDDIEFACDCLKMEIINILENEDEDFRQDAYDDASKWMAHIGNMMDSLV